MYTDTRGECARTRGAQEVTDHRGILLSRWECRVDFDDISCLDHLKAVGRVRRLRVESGQRLGDRHGNGSVGFFAASENAAAASRLLKNSAYTQTAVGIFRPVPTPSCRRMLKKAVQQGRSEQRGEAYASVR